MHISTIRVAHTTLLLCSIAVGAQAESFNRISSFSTEANIPADLDKTKTESSAEIITASPDGMMLIYSDSPLEGVGFTDITDPKNPKGAGFIKTEGEPTSVAMGGLPRSSHGGHIDRTVPTISSAPLTTNLPDDGGRN